MELLRVYRMELSTSFIHGRVTSYKAARLHLRDHEVRLFCLLNLVEVQFMFLTKVGVDILFGLLSIDILNTLIHVARMVSEGVFNSSIIHILSDILLTLVHD